MSREFRIAVNVTLPADEMEEAEAKLQAFKVKAAIQKLVGEYKLIATVEHETVTPRTSTPKIVPGAPSQSSVVHTDPAPVTGLSSHPTEPIAGTAPRRHDDGRRPGNVAA
jgi:hypothetical protein